ncbi:hypothetical protein Dimus_013637 [Dionaea muscipula]
MVTPPYYPGFSPNDFIHPLSPVTSFSLHPLQLGYPSSPLSTVPFPFFFIHWTARGSIKVRESWRWVGRRHVGGEGDRHRRFAGEFTTSSFLCFSSLRLMDDHGV